MYLITYCPRCGKPMIINTSNQTRKCPYCKTKSKLVNLRIIARVKNNQEATAVIQKLKESKGDPDRKLQFKKYTIKNKEM